MYSETCNHLLVVELFSLMACWDQCVLYRILHRYQKQKQRDKEMMMKFVRCGRAGGKRERSFDWALGIRFDAVWGTVVALPSPFLKILHTRVTRTHTPPPSLCCGHRLFWGQEREARGEDGNASLVTTKRTVPFYSCGHHKARAVFLKGLFSCTLQFKSSGSPTYNFTFSKNILTVLT